MRFVLPVRIISVISGFRLVCSRRTPNVVRFEKNFFQTHNRHFEHQAHNQCAKEGQKYVSKVINYLKIKILFLKTSFSFEQIFLLRKENDR